MFDDPFSTLMAMFFLCFIGMLIMFLFVIKSLSDVSASLRDVVRKQSLGFAELEQHLMEISFAKRGEIPQNNVPLATASDAPEVMTDSDLSALLTSISDSRMAASESLLPFEHQHETNKKDPDASFVGLFDTSPLLDQNRDKNTDSIHDKSLLHMEPKYK